MAVRKLQHREGGVYFCTFTLYGSSRVGVDNYELELCALDLVNYDPLTDPPGDQRYELSDHLGNVTSVLTDELLGVDVDADLDYDYFQPHVVSAQGYEPGGFLLPGRNYSSSSYNFGFGGQMKDDEVYGATGTSYTAEFWQYDTRTGRRWNLDPVFKPWQSSYATFSLNPIWRVDPNGDDDYYNYAGKWVGNDGQGTGIRLVASKDAFNSLMGSGREALREHTRIVDVRIDDAENAMHLLYANSVNDGYEHKAYVILDTKNATLTLEEQPRHPDDDDASSYNEWDSYTRGGDKYKSPKGNAGEQVIVGQVHGHPGEGMGYTNRIPGTSDGDAQAAKDLGTPVYAIDGGTLWKVDQNGNEPNGVCPDECFPLLRDALETSGGKPPAETKP